MSLTRRDLALGAAGAGLAAGLAPHAAAQEAQRPVRLRAPRIGVSTYSFWRFEGPKEDWSMERCIDLAAEMDFDGVELLHVQMASDEPAALAAIKRRAFVNGLALCGFSTHQGFVSPDAEVRRANVEKTLRQIELAHALGIPTLRLNTGRWGTTESFDELMANRGIEPPLEGYTDEEGFAWVIAAIEELVPRAAELGVVLGLENHWGLGRTAAGVLRIVRAIDSPWLGVTLDTGNFLEDPYDQLEALADRAVLVQAKTYFGGGKWYTLELDYPRIGRILREARFRGWVSLEYEGLGDPLVEIPRSLDLLRESLG